MQQTNYLNLRDGDKDRYVYRIIPVKRHYDLFTKRENVLVRPARWEDPFENFILNSKARLPDGEIVQFSFNNDFYGQCWTLLTTSDAMWRIYSPGAQSVRIRTTVRKLVDSLSTALGEWANVQVFIGKVHYLTDKQLLSFADNVFAHGLNPVALAETLLVKRKAFVHEKEVRLLYFEKSNRSAEDLFHYDVNPNALVDQIMIDPHLSKDDADDLKEKIKDETGFTGTIKRSLLYAPLKGMIFPIGL